MTINHVAPCAAVPHDAAEQRPACAGRKFEASHQADDSVNIFQKQWELYQRLIAGDYICHAGLYGAVDAFFRQRRDALKQTRVVDGGTGATTATTTATRQQQHKTTPRGLCILDLGCGDAHCLALSLESSGAAPFVAAYTGVDMSAPALSVARENLARALGGGGGGGEAAPPAEVLLVEGDMLGFCRGCPEGAYDVVFASLALHHLPDGQKRELLRLVAERALAPGGQLLVVDAFLAQGEDRESYMRRFAEDVSSGYGALSNDEKAAVLGHVTNYDYPWDMQLLESWAEEPVHRGAGGDGDRADAGVRGGVQAASSAAFPGGAVVLYEEKFFKTVLLT